MYGSQVVKYPVSDSARKAVGQLELKDMVTEQTLKEVKARIDALLGHRKYVPQETDDSLWAFFITSLLMSRFDKLSYRFASEEAERMKECFVRDRDNRPFTFSDCLGDQFILSAEKTSGGQQLATIPVERYLGLVDRYNIRNDPGFKLVNQALSGGTVTIAYDAVGDLFGACIRQKTLNMIGNLRHMPLPDRLNDLEAMIVAARPQEEKDRERAESRKYAYIEELLKRPVADGRHRLLWLVLAPYLVNVKKLSEDAAIDQLVEYAKKSGDKKDLKRVVIDNVKRAKRIGLKPPTLNTLRRKHSDVYNVLPTELKLRKGR